MRHPARHGALVLVCEHAGVERILLHALGTVSFFYNELIDLMCVAYFCDLFVLAHAFMLSLSLDLGIIGL